ncbi:MAG TPA: phosphatidylglycerol lysyltransferase domain-containing protein [Streptosporangiaceae bacterium]|nr:phosphatidylglycerol lysyltransferase domain-containing protein [Streptosporangiaceae bacterium]
MSDSDVAGHANGADLTSAKSGGSRGAHGEPVDRRHQHAWVPAGAALLTALIGLSDIIAIFKPDWTHRLNKINYLVPGTLNVGIRSADVIIGLMLLMLAHGLRRRKRRAFQAVTALLAFDIGIHFYHSQFNMERVPTAIIALVLLVALLYFRDEFYAEGDPRTRWRALWVFAGLVVADVAIGLIYILFARGLEANYSFTQRVQEVIYGLVGVSGPVQWVPEARGDLFNVLTGALGFFTLVVTVYLFLRPAEPRARLGLADAGRVRELLGKYGDRDSLGYFALRDDKSVIWSPTGKACVCYRVVSGVMLASGDPIGDPEAWPGAIGPFLDEAARHAWAPAVMGCSELGAEVWCREGNLTALELGDEAVVNVADFSLSGRSMRNVRQMVNRVAKNGYEAEVRRVGDIPPRELDAIMRAADTWRGSQTERGFSMALGRIGGPGDEDCVLATAKENGVDRAVLQLVPWGADGLSLDLMRRDKGAQPGLNDFLIVEAIKAAPGLGVKRISLNFAVFRAALERGERIGAGPVLRAWRSVLIFLSKWFQIESLYKFNAKFGPVWQPRFFVFPSTKDAPRIAVAALEAEAFLVWPRLEMRRIARKLGLGRLRRQLRRVPPRGMGASRARP